MNKYIVYEHLFPNGKRYIGITKELTCQRWKKDGKGYKTQTVYKAIQKYGWDNIQHNILFTGLTENEACEKEKELIEFYKTNNKSFGYNNTSGGEHGYEVSEETRKRMSKAQKGIPCSEKTKEVNRAKRLGKPRPIEEVIKTANTLRGRKIGCSELRKRRIKEGIDAMSQEKKSQWRENISKSLSNVKQKNHIGKQVLQIDIETNEIVNTFESLKEAERQTGFSRRHLSDICKRKYKDGRDVAYGFRWKLGDTRGYK